MTGGYKPEDDPEYRAGANELLQHVRNTNPSWEGEGGSGGDGGGKGCSLIPALIMGSGIVAAYVGHKYGGMA